MRDIRHDLEERIALITEQVNAEETALERRINALMQEHENKVRDLTADLNAVSSVLRCEQRRLKNSPPAPQPEDATPEAEAPHPQDAEPRQSLLEMLMRKLSTEGPTSCEQLRQWAIREGHLGDTAIAKAALQEALTETAKLGIIRQLPDGSFAASSITDLIRQRREA